MAEEVSSGWVLIGLEIRHNQCWRLRMRIVTLFVFLIAHVSLPAKQNELTREEVKSGWRLLFDGRSLEGWMWSRDPEVPQPSWAVRDGVLMTTPGTGKEVYLLTKDSFTDFEFAFEWRAEARANSGVKYRIQMYGESTRRIEPVGFEYQITDDDANPDALSTPRHTAGALYDYVEPHKAGPAHAKIWHRARIVARGLHIEHWLDDVKVIDVDLDTEEAAASFGQSKRQSASMLRRQEKRESPIALQIHDGVVEFRNLKLRPLK